MEFGSRNGSDEDRQLQQEARRRFDDYELETDRTSGEYCPVHFTELPLTRICPDCEDLH